MPTRRIPLLICLFTALLATLAAAQASPAAAPAMPAQTASPSPSAQSNSSAYPDTILEYAPPPAQYERARNYSHARYRNFVFSTLYGLLILLVILQWRVAPFLRNLAERIASRRSLQLLIFAPLTLFTIALLGIVTDINDHSLDLKFGLSVQAWRPWLRDWFMNQFIQLIVGTVLVAILYAVVRRSTRRWWFYFWLASIPVLLFVFFLQPMVIDPLFYTFKPLEGAQPVLLAEMQKVVHRGRMDIPPERMFVMNASSKQTGLNAYVTGFGASKRVVVWDNTIAKATVPETLFVFGHEMGHYVLLHIPKEITIDASILLILLYLGYRLAQGMLARRGAQWDIRDLGDLASLPMLLFLLSVLSFLATPAFNAISRHFEHEADRYGLEVIHDIVPNENQVAAHYFEKSGEMNLSDPDPNWFTKAWFFDHPTRPERVHFVATYDPWSKGEAPVYVK